MEKWLTLAIVGADFESEAGQQALTAIGGRLLTEGHGASWVVCDFQAGLFSSELKNAKRLDERLRQLLPGARAVAFDFHDQGGRARHFLEGDRYNPPVGAPGFWFMAGRDEVAFAEQLGKLETELARQDRAARKERKRQGLEKPQLISLDEPLPAPVAAASAPEQEL